MNDVSGILYLLRTGWKIISVSGPMHAWLLQNREGMTVTSPIPDAWILPGEKHAD